ncbi:MAG TPA: META domain-containing protein [Burkholderiales bacterium]|nr:META domain-containing protein [Burkholderiales bacterium]
MKLVAPVLLAALLLAACSTATQSSAPGPGAELLETYWRPVEIDGNGLTIHPGTREPYFILRREGGRVVGYSGCNTLAGSFQQSSGSLRFGKLAMTRMACVGETGSALEAAFTKALNDTESYRINGDVLELRNAAGAVRMKLEARPLP